VNDVTRAKYLASAALPFLLAFASSVHAQDLQNRAAEPPPPPSTQPTEDGQMVDFSANTLDYDSDNDIVTATGDVRMYRQSDRLRADKVVWNRKTGQVVATGNIVVENPGGDMAYGDSIELTDTLKDGVIDNMLLVLNEGGRMAAQKGTRQDNIITLDNAAYTPCAVANSSGCPKNPSWKITAVKVVYRPDRKRVYYTGAQIDLFGLPSLPLPKFSHPVGGGNQSGLLSPDIKYNGTNGLEVAVPYYFNMGPNRGLTVTPHVFSGVLPMAQVQYQALTSKGAFTILAYATASRRSDDLLTEEPTGTENAFRGYIDGIGNFQLSPNWSFSASIRIATDPTFLRRYEISDDDVLRNTISLERIDTNSYFSISGWAIQTLRVNDPQGLQPIALPEIDYRKLYNGLLGGRLEVQINSLALTRTAGQDTQRAFASAEWTKRVLTDWGQEVTFTAFARGDLYHTDDILATTVASYRGDQGFSDRLIGALAVDVKWPLIGPFLKGIQRLTPRFQIVASPKTANLNVPNEDARAVDLEDSNLFALNRFPGYDRWEDSTRFTYGLDWAVDLPGITIQANIGQSYRLSSRPTLFPDGTGLTDRLSDIVGRTEIRFHDFVSIVHRYRLDKDNFAVRVNEIDSTIGSRSTYLLLGYLRLNRNIDPTLEDLQDDEEVRVGGRIQINRFWSLYGSTIIDLTTKQEDPLSLTDGFSPVRHRVGIAYEDDCLKLGLTWRREYEDTGDALAGDSYLLTLSFKNLGR
jgi:LPS-assembly protein